MTPAEHRAGDRAGVACAVITVSDTRTRETDIGGQRICALLAERGHRVTRHDIVRDEPDQVRSLVAGLCAAGDCAAVLLTGGTGLAARDTTFEAIDALLEKRIEGFGELFRMLSFAEIGAAAMLSRATAGVCRGVAVFSMPGSPGAVELAMQRLILPELGHLAGLLRGRATERNEESPAV